MGWLKRFFGFFVENEGDSSSELEIIYFNDLKSWLDNLLNDNLNKHKLGEDLTTYFNEVKDKRWLLEAKLDQWQENLTGPNENVTEIFQDTRKFLELLAVPSEKNIESASKLNLNFSTELDNLLRKIEQSEFMINFSYILTDVEKKNVNVNPLMKELFALHSIKDQFNNTIVQSGLVKIKSLQEKVERLNQYQEKIDLLSKDLDSKSSRLQNAESRRKEKEKGLHQLKDNTEYTSLSNNKSRKKEIFTSIEQNEDKVFSFFSKLKPSLRQYSYLDPNNHLLLDYLENPIKTFFADQNLVIHSILKQLRDSLLSNLIKLEPEEKNKIMGILEQSDTDYLEKLHKENEQSNQELVLLREVVGNKDFLLRVEDAQYRYNHFSKQVDKLRDEVLSLEDEMKSTIFTRDRETEMFKNLVKISLNKEVEIRI